MILRHFPELCLSLDSGYLWNNKPIDVIGKHAKSSSNSVAVW